MLAEREVGLVAAKQRVNDSQQEQLRTQHKHAPAAQIRAFLELE